MGGVHSASLHFCILHFAVSRSYYVSMSTTHFTIVSSHISPPMQLTGTNISALIIHSPFTLCHLARYVPFNSTSFPFSVQCPTQLPSSEAMFHFINTLIFSGART